MRVYFICVGNAGRSQMAEAFAKKLGLQAQSAGSQPAKAVLPTVIQAMAEKGHDLSKAFPKPIDIEFAESADLVVTMGCGDACPYVPKARIMDWALSDPKELGLSGVREVRDEIERRVRVLAMSARA